MVSSRRAQPQGHLPGLLLPTPHLLGQPLLPHAATGDPPTWAGRSGSASGGVTAPYCGYWYMQDFACAKNEVSLFPQCCGSPVIKSHWLSKSDSLGSPSPSPSPLPGSPGWEAWCGVQSLPNTGRTSLVLLFSSLWVVHWVGMGFYFIVIAHLIPCHCDFSFVFGRGISFFWWFPASSCQRLWNSCNFGALADECTFFYSAILN